MSRMRYRPRNLGTRPMIFDFGDLITATLRGSLCGETRNHKHKTHTERSENLSPSSSDALTNEINPKSYCAVPAERSVRIPRSDLESHNHKECLQVRF